MQGEGELGEWLKQTGREVARAAGSELKSVAKDKAASYARSMIGEGLKEELGDAAGAVGKVAMEEAKKHGKHKAKELIDKYTLAGMASGAHAHTRSPTFARPLLQPGAPTTSPGRPIERS